MSNLSPLNIQISEAIRRSGAGERIEFSATEQLDIFKIDPFQFHAVVHDKVPVDVLKERRAFEVQFSEIGVLRRKFLRKRK